MFWFRNKKNNFSYVLLSGGLHLQLVADLDLCCQEASSSGYSKRRITNHLVASFVSMVVIGWSFL